MNLRDWNLKIDSDGIAWASLDRVGTSTNTLSCKVMSEFSLLLEELERDAPRGLIIRSGKDAGFIAGADIEEFAAIDSPAAVHALVQRGWDLFDRLAAVRFPTLALIHGHCMGGGLELALACRYRVALADPRTRLALPEVMLGIVPGWGGMLRLPALVGPAAALDMMLSGRGVDAKKAKRLGLVDECVPERVMHNAARMLVVSGRPRRRPPFMQRLLNGPLRKVLAAQARKHLVKRARPEHYPAPYAILDIWANHAGNALVVPAQEPTSLEAIMNSPTTRNLLRVFFLQERLKGFGKQTEFAPHHIHVVGAGTMGSDIAAWCALRGMTVSLQDQSMQLIAPAIRRAAEFYERKLRGDRKQVRMTLDRLIPDPEGHGVRQADLVIEAISESLDAKRALFAAIESRLKSDALLATNTSSLRIEAIADVMREPSRLVGIHFFNPVPKMPLVEVVSGERTDPEVARRAAAFVRRVDKLPLPVRSAPGFLVNAVLGPYMLEAMRCVDEGMRPETVDEAARRFGMPLGPIELADRVGLDVAAAAGKQIAGAGTALPRTLEELLGAGKLGKKTGGGFYAYADGKARKATPGAIPSDLTQRILAPLFDAARRCVAEGVVADADLADAGVIFGTGFAPFTGGPLNYLAARGNASCADPGAVSGHGHANRFAKAA